jgi:hypothetical protein
VAHGKVDLNEVIKQAGRGPVGGARSLRNGLAAGEIALATILLIGAVTHSESGELRAGASRLQLARADHVPTGSAARPISAQRQSPSVLSGAT